MTDLRPLFVLSQPRSGSTFLQRVLAAHDGIATTAEPWVLLPLISSVSERRGQTLVAVGEFLDQLDGGRQAFAADVRDLALRTYARAAPPGTRYFLDKTPNYHLLADDIVDLFPDGRFVVLWRNPLSVVASNLATFRLRKDRGRPTPRFHPYGFRVDLFDAPQNLLRVQRRHPGRVHAVRYEDLVSGSRESWEALFAYLGMPFDPAALSRFSDVQLTGKFKDPTGIAKYSSVSREPLEKWKAYFTTPLRRAWAHHYLDWLGEGPLAEMGYEAGQLRADLSSEPLRVAGTRTDVTDLLYTRLWRWRTRATRRAYAAEPWRAILGDPAGASRS